MKNSTVLPENTDSDLAMSTESPRGGEQLDDELKWALQSCFTFIKRISI